MGRNRGRMGRDPRAPVCAFFAGGACCQLSCSLSVTAEPTMITRQLLQPPRLSRSPAPARVIRPGSGADPQPSPKASQRSSAQPSRLRAGPHDPRPLRARTPLSQHNPPGPAQAQAQASRTQSQAPESRRHRICTLRKASRPTVPCDCPLKCPRPRSPGTATPADRRLSGRAKCDLFPALEYPPKGVTG
jgi:hypothetical protein